MNRKAQPPKADTKAARKWSGKRITLPDKYIITDTYDSEMAKGKKSRDEILSQLERVYDRSPRQIERYIEEAHQLPRQEVCAIIRTWIAQIKTAIQPPRELLMRCQDIHSEPKQDSIYISDSFWEKVKKELAEGTARLCCQVEDEVLFPHLLESLLKKLKADYQKWQEKGLEYILDCQNTFHKFIDGQQLDVEQYMKQVAELTRMWQEVEELRINITGQLERTLKSFERFAK